MAKDPGGHSPIEVSRFLKGIDFPAKRDDLLHHAKQNQASEEVLKEIEQMPDESYSNMADVMKGFGKTD